MLKQKLECALQLARTVSHDFNNALTSILGHTSFLLSKCDPDHPWRRSLMEVEKSAAAAAEIANELQMFSRQDKETQRAPSGNLNTVVNRCVEFFRTAHGGNIQWNLQLEKALYATRFDEAKVQQAVTKILENAVEAIVGGVVQITVHTRNIELADVSRDGNVRLSPGAYVCVEIADTGRGIPPDILPRIFEPFFTTKREGHRGLGLALVYGIMSNHGGGVAVSSEPGRGTSARLYLPAEKRVVGDGTPAKSADLHGSETILVVDDEDMLLTMAETILSDYGYKVLTARSGEAALGLLSRGEPKVDLLITDLVMPGMGGRELMERVRQSSPNMKMICMSGYVPTVDKQAGVTPLRKPFSSLDLLKKVKETTG
ncbi:MAG: response regulator [Verrucomicrobia bacterium]|nr:response regulator [Verrucomicrobiota bacterium]MDE3099085.1 response regulator [Verrucomicrobiota bacterium]